ncbi:MAG TPA: hypothetical protein PKG52_03275 [bacterium]|nr:hypothetical protein [bacterium]HPS29641.1 hypothetical protein [bacterium]
MKITLFILTTFILLFFWGCKVQIDQQLPEDAIVLDQILFIDEVQSGVPQTLQLPNGTVVTYKMPEKIYDGQLIKVKHVEGERPYYIKISLRNRNEQKNK